MDYILPEISYDSRDFEGIRDDMIQQIPFFSEEWTDHNPTDFGIVLLELFAGIADVMHYYIDRVDQNTALPTAFTRQAAVSILKMLSYTLSSPSAASVDMTFTYNARITTPADIPIPAGTRVQSDSGLVFETTELLTIPDQLLTADTDGTEIISVVDGTNFEAGKTCAIGDDNSSEIERIIAEVDGNNISFTTTVPAVYSTAQNAYCYQKAGTVSAEEGESDSETGFISTGKPFQYFELETEDIIDGTITFDWDGTDYEIQTNLARSGPTDTHCYIERTADNLVVVYFGDNSKGKIPPKNATLTANFKVGGGSDGNVGAGTIRTLLDTIVVGVDTVSLSVSNAASASGGGPEESLEEAKQNGPTSISTLERAVSLEDYEDLTLLEIASVGKASAQKIGFGGVRVVIAPQGGGTASQSLIASTQTLLDEKGAADFIMVESAVFVGIDMTATFNLFSNASRTRTLAAIRTAIEDFYDFANRDFGGRDAQNSNVRKSDLIGIFEGVSGVDTVDISKLSLDPTNTVSYDVYSGDYTIGNLALYDGAASEIVTVTFLNSTTFTVVGETTGTHPNGTIDVDYSSKNGEFAFLISSDTIGPRRDDRITFKTSLFLSNTVSLEENWIAEEGVSILNLSGGIA